MANKINERLKKDLDAKSSGLIINSCGWVDGMGYDLLLHIIAVFAVDVVLVMGDDRLYFSLTSSIQDKVVVVKLPRSGGVVERDNMVRKRARKNKISEYFYGRKVVSGQPQLLSPCRSDTKLSSLVIMRVGVVQLSEAMLPIGQAASKDPLTLVTVTPTKEDLLHAVLAVMHPNCEDDTGEVGAASGSTSPASFNLCDMNVAGFLYVVEVDLEADSIVVLLPCPGALPSKYLLMGSLNWVE